MSPQNAFKMWWGLNLHFSSIDYNMLKYGYNTRPAQSKLDSMSKAKMYRFEWLGTRFPDTQDFVYAMLGCIFSDVDVQFGKKDDILEAYYKFKSRREGMTYNLKSNMSQYESEGCPDVTKLILKYLSGKYSPEFIILLCYDTDKLSEMYNSDSLSWARGSILKLIKYGAFFNAPKYLKIVNKNENHVIAC